MVSTLEGGESDQLFYGLQYGEFGELFMVDNPLIKVQSTFNI